MLKRLLRRSSWFRISDVQGVSTFRFLKDIFLGVFIVCGGIYFLMAIGSTSSPPHMTEGQPQNGESVPVASEGRLDNGNTNITLAVDQDGLQEMIQAANQDLNRLTWTAPVFVVAKGTLVRVTESGVNSQRVRIQSGPQKGRSGWVPLGWVKPLS
jgi:hypothetical protein